MNLKNAALFTAISLTLVGGSLTNAMASMVGGDNHMTYERRSEQRNRQYYSDRAQVNDYMQDSLRENMARPEEGVVFEQVSFLKGRTFYTERFEIYDQGTYQVSLTDFSFPNPLKMAGLNITTATESLGSLMETGSFTFEADPGNYYLSFFGKADYLGQYGIQIAEFGSMLSETGASPVPVPAAAWLFGSGVLGLAGVMRRKAA